LADASSPNFLFSLIDDINRAEARFAPLTDAQLRQQWQSCATRARSTGFKVEIHLEFTRDAFAIIREAGRRALGMRAYDVQIMAALAMAHRAIAEMATGEGKTLVAGLAATYYSLHGKGVHVATVNRYLAERDAGLMTPLFAFLGISIGTLRENDTPDAKHHAYLADITYGTGYEFGFDYLRDQLFLQSVPAPRPGTRLSDALMGRAVSQPRATQRLTPYAIVDEIDSVLIDEAITPLVISVSGSDPNKHPRLYYSANELAASLAPHDYEIKTAQKSAKLTESGLKKVYRPDAHPDSEGLQRAWHLYVEQALRAQHCFHRDSHYLIRKGKIEIIDENTGRSFADRKWQDGLHQAVEAHQDITITQETSSEVNISRQAFYQLYPNLCGMTGTARESADELADIYRLRVIAIPRHRPSQLEILPDKVFATWAQKVDAMVDEIARRHLTGQPILVGTRTVRHSDELAHRLQSAGLNVCVLNARQDAEEADLIHGAGQLGRITIATNMAGRGADIPLDPAAAQRGGLFVLGQERNESSRVDRQLVGRAGRQGAPGCAQFFLSAEDHLLQTHAPDNVRALRRQTAAPDGQLAPAAATIFQTVQRGIEAIQMQERKALMRHDEWLSSLKRHFATA